MSGQPLLRTAACLLVSLVAAGCGARHPVAAGPALPPTAAVVPAGVIAGASPNVASTAARVPAARSTTIETADALLAAALQRAILEPGPSTYRALAAEYRRLGIFDQAQSYLLAARDLAPKDAATHDALARLWRDAGFPRFALADASRAVSYAPDSAIAHNTLGTVLQALGERALAVTEYQRALALDPRAAYALNNLCYAWMLDGDAQRAVAACRQAIAIDPAMTAARNNLALAYAATGQTAAARATFEAAGDHAAAQYNLGIVHLARREYRSAVDAFVQAHQLRPSITDALARARQASGPASGAGE